MQFSIESPTDPRRPVRRFVAETADWCLFNGLVGLPIIVTACRDFLFVVTSDRDFDRRSVLKALGVAGVVGAGGTGLSLASGGSETQSNGKEDDSHVHPEWVRQYERTDDGAEISTDFGVDVDVVDDGYVLGGDAEKDEREVMWLAKTDTAGKRTWERTYGLSVDGTEYNTRLNHVVQSDDGYALAGGRRQYDSDGEGDTLSYSYAHAVVTDENGNVRWSDATEEYPYQSAVALDDGYAFVGKAGDALVRKFDHDGNVEWEYTWDDDAHHYTPSGAVEAVASDDGGVVVLTYSGYGTGKDYWALKVSADGTEEWYTKLVLEGVTREADIDRLDDGYVISGTVSGPGMLNPPIALTMLSADGDVEWKVSKGFRLQVSADPVTRLGDGYALGLSGTYPAVAGDAPPDAPKPGTSEVRIYRFDADGTLRWKYSNPDLPFGLQDIESTTDGNLVAAGSYGSDDKRVALAKFRVDEGHTDEHAGESDGESGDTNEGAGSEEDTGSDDGSGGNTGSTDDSDRTTDSNDESAGNTGSSGQQGSNGSNETGDRSGGGDGDAANGC